MKSTRSRKKRRGTNLIELIGCILMLSFAFMTIAALSARKLEDADNLYSQQAQMSADAFMSSFYRDYISSTAVDIQGDSATGLVSVVMTNAATGEISYYSYSDIDHYCYYNGMEQFKAREFSIIELPDSVIISIKLPNEKILDAQIWR